MKRLAVCIALCAAIGCGSASSQNKNPVTPLTPTPVDSVPSPRPLTGVWTGMFDVSSCTGSVEWCRITDPESFSLRLDADLRGVAELELWRRVPLAIDIAQGHATDGSTILKGVSNISAQPAIDLEIHLEGTAASGLTGSVHYTMSGERFGESKSSVVTRTGPILFIREVTTVRAGALQGTWRGYLKRTACSGNCEYVRETTQVNFWFSQRGSNLTGIFDWGYGWDDELEGTATGQEFTFTRTLNPPNCRSTFQDKTVCQDSVDFRGSVDSLGRLSGIMRRSQAGIDYYNGPFSWTATLELEGVVRVPGTLDR